MTEKIDIIVSRVDFPHEFCLSVNSKHFSNTDDSIKIINGILGSYFEPQGKGLTDSRCFPRSNDQ